MDLRRRIEADLENVLLRGERVHAWRPVAAEAGAGDRYGGPARTARRSLTGARDVPHRVNLVVVTDRRILWCDRRGGSERIVACGAVELTAVGDIRIEPGRNGTGKLRFTIPPESIVQFDLPSKYLIGEFAAGVLRLPACTAELTVDLDVEALPPVARDRAAVELVSPGRSRRSRRARRAGRIRRVCRRSGAGAIAMLVGVVGVAAAGIGVGAPPPRGDSWGSGDYGTVGDAGQVAVVETALDPAPTPAASPASGAARTSPASPAPGATAVSDPTTGSGPASADLAGLGDPDRQFDVVAVPDADEPPDPTDPPSPPAEPPTPTDDPGVPADDVDEGDDGDDDAPADGDPADDGEEGGDADDDEDDDGDGVAG